MYALINGMVTTVIYLQLVLIAIMTVRVQFSVYPLVSKQWMHDYYSFSDAPNTSKGDRAGNAKKVSKVLEGRTATNIPVETGDTENYVTFPISFVKSIPFVALSGVYGSGYTEPLVLAFGDIFKTKYALYCYSIAHPEFVSLSMMHLTAVFIGY